MPGLSANERKSVLVVEDDPDLRRIFRDALRFSGFDTREAADGTEALRILEGNIPTVVVLDLGLPTLDGLSVRAEIAAQPQSQHVAIVIVTGSSVALGPLRNVSRVLRKPVTPQQLVTAVRAASEASPRWAGLS